MTLSAVLFDMDGLLVDTEPIWQRAEDRAVAELGGTEWTPEDQRAVLGASLPLAGEYLLVGKGDQGFQDRGVKRRSRCKTIKHAVSHPAGRYVPTSVTAGTVGHQEGGKAPI